MVVYLFLAYVESFHIIFSAIFSWLYPENILVDGDSRLAAAFYIRLAA